MALAQYRALEDCYFDGMYYTQGETFTGRVLEGYDKETATHLELVKIYEDEPAPTKKGRKAAAQDDDL